MEKHQNANWCDLLELSNSGDGEKLQFFEPPEIIVENVDADISEGNSSREISIEFQDSENERKFEKLVTDKKIKSPFKRRLSNEKIGETANKEEDQDEKRTKLDGESPKKRLRTESTDSSSTGSSFRNREVETDRDVLDRRQKQVDYGKNTIGYDNYMKQVPRFSRGRDHPKTPPKHLKYSRRAWEGLIKSWRKKLHAFDPQNSKEEIDSDEETS